MLKRNLCTKMFIKKKNNVQYFSHYAQSVFKAWKNAHARMLDEQHNLEKYMVNPKCSAFISFVFLTFITTNNIF